jgi:hypothetical protein
MNFSSDFDLEQFDHIFQKGFLSFRVGQPIETVGVISAIITEPSGRR